MGVTVIGFAEGLYMTTFFPFISSDYPFNVECGAREFVRKYFNFWHFTLWCGYKIDAQITCINKSCLFLCKNEPKLC